MNQRRHIDYDENKDEQELENENKVENENEDEIENENESEQQQQPRLEWRTGDWSRCSQTCGQDGKQIRSAECIVLNANGSSEVIPQSLCLDSGMTVPETVRECGIGACPQWKVQQWQSCSEAKCVDRHTGQ